MTKEMTITDEMWEAVQVRLASGVVAKVAPTMVARVNHRMCAMCGKAITTILKVDVDTFMQRGWCSGCLREPTTR